MTTKNEAIDTIHVASAPTIPGLRFRHYRGEIDHPLMAAVFNTCMPADGLEEIRTVEDIARECEPREEHNPYRDLLIAEVEGEPNEGMIGYGFVFFLEEESGNLIYHSGGYVLPAWRRMGIGRGMLHHNQTVMRQVAADHSQEQPRLFESVAADTQAGATALLLSEGYEPCVYFALMVRPDLGNIPEAPMPDGLEVRPVTPEHYRAIWDANAEAFRDHWGYVPPNEEDYQRWLTNTKTFQPELWKIAWDGDQVAGQVKSFINHAENEAYGRKRGYAEFISVGRPWRRRGLARSLIVQSLHELKARGMTEAALGVHTDNPNGAFRLYESVGFRQTRLTVLYQKPMD
jgi:ribosomal protein S18 acetylase RimI-like enzyme